MNDAVETKRVFVSHKSNDKDLALSIVQELKGRMDHIEFFMSEDITKGDEWRTEIARELQKSDFLLLIYTAPTYDWSWCLYEAILFDELRAAGSTGDHKLYCIHYPGSPPPDPLQNVQTIAATNNDISAWLADFYRATQQSDAFRALEAAASRIEEILRKAKAPEYFTNYLRPSIRVYPAWLRDERATPNWRNLSAIPRDLPLSLSEVTTDDISASELGFNQTPDRMNVVEFLKRLDTEATNADRVWISQFIESLQATLEGRIADQNVVFFRSVRGNILRPIIESITRSTDGSECVCRVVFVDAFSAPPSGNPSQLQLLANGLRLAVRMRLEVLDRYRGRMAREYRRLKRSKDPAQELGKLHPLGGRVLEILRTIVLEAEMQGSRLEAAPANLFDDTDQERYEELRERFKSIFAELKMISSEEDQGDGRYPETEKVLDVLHEINRDYIQIAGPKFLSSLNARIGSHSDAISHGVGRAV
jgi:hypothetical protein